MEPSNPMLLTIPMPIITPRLIIRPYRETDGAGLSEAFLESINELKQWMPWAQQAAQEHAVENEMLFIRQAIAKWMLREELRMLLVDKTDDQKIMGTIGFKDMNWAVPKMEIGYWLRTSMTGQGLMSEAVNALTRYGFEQLEAQRISIHCDEQNEKSRKIPERLGYAQEGILKNYAQTADGSGLSNTVIYARYDAKNLPELNVTW